MERDKRRNMGELVDFNFGDFRDEMTRLEYSKMLHRISLDRTEHGMGDISGDFSDNITRVLMAVYKEPNLYKVILMSGLSAMKLIIKIAMKHTRKPVADDVMRAFVMEGDKLTRYAMAEGKRKNEELVYAAMVERAQHGIIIH